MAALVLAVLAFGPSIDAYVCRDEAIHSVTAASDAGQAAQQADAIHTDAGPSDTGHPGHGDGLGPCAHGHCHAVFFISPLPAQVREAKAVTQRLPLLRASVSLSNLQFGLMRPPRA